MIRAKGLDPLHGDMCIVVAGCSDRALSTLRLVTTTLQTKTKTKTRKRSLNLRLHMIDLPFFASNATTHKFVANPCHPSTQPRQVLATATQRPHNHPPSHIATQNKTIFFFQIRDYIAEKLGGVGPRFVGILANTDPAARKYAEWTGRACIKDGIRYEVWLRGVPVAVMLVWVRVVGCVAVGRCVKGVR